MVTFQTSRVALGAAFAVSLCGALAVRAGEVRGRVAWPVTSTAPTVVWIEGTQVDAATIRQPVVVRQKEMQFVPAFTVASKGQTIQFPNEDDVAHSVFSRSPVKPFQLGVFEEQARRSVLADRPGVIDVKCALHRNMSATLFVINSAHYAMAQPNGMFAIRNVPPGKQRVRVWRADGASLETEVQVNGDEPTLVTFQAPQLTAAR